MCCAANHSGTYSRFSWAKHEELGGLVLVGPQIRSLMKIKRESLLKSVQNAAFSPNVALSKTRIPISFAWVSGLIMKIARKLEFYLESRKLDNYPSHSYSFLFHLGQVGQYYNSASGRFLYPVISCSLLFCSFKLCLKHYKRFSSILSPRKSLAVVPLLMHAFVRRES